MKEKELLNQIRIGWISMFLTLFILLVLMIFSSIFMDDNFRYLRMDPGKTGLILLNYIAALYLLMPAAVSIIDPMKSRVGRWICVAITVVIFMYFIAHHAGHWYFGDRQTVTSHLLDVVHHVLSIYVLTRTIQWAKYPVNSEA